MQSPGATAGLVIGCIILAILKIFLCYWIQRWRTYSQRQTVVVRTEVNVATNPHHAGYNQPLEQARPLSTPGHVPNNPSWNNKLHAPPAGHEQPTGQARPQITPGYVGNNQPWANHAQDDAPPPYSFTA
ncbi:uncharacterized protein LOC128212279 [Mya arenaria]|uniref:uncharacterized protein LOC128212279 n=1 Tax=Mya arenaria TaxID=6604 RepID=UPI0022E88C6A|nr:uncharacterized protein LOC128212279 [Mya arenaria]